MPLPQNPLPGGHIAANLAKLRQLIRRIPVCMVNTSAGDGSIHSRPMAYVPLPSHPDGLLCFFTHADSAKVEEVARNRQVTVTFSDPGRHVQVIVRGRATVSNDRGEIIRRFTPGLERWFPNGVSDPALRLFNVEPEVAEYWEGLSGLNLILDIARTSITGTSRDPGEHSSLAL